MVNRQKVENIKVVWINPKAVRVAWVQIYKPKWVAHPVIQAIQVAVRPVIQTVDLQVIMVIQIAAHPEIQAVEEDGDVLIVVDRIKWVKTLAQDRDQVQDQVQGQVQDQVQDRVPEIQVQETQDQNQVADEGVVEEEAVCIN